MRHLLHKNFKNLNPKYEEQRYQRAVDLARHWERIIGAKLVEKVRDQARKNFNAQIASGQKLSLEDLKLLGTLNKGDYIKHMLKEEEENRQFLFKVQEKVNKKHEEISQLIWGITDTT